MTKSVSPCFTPGIMIATPRGEVPVETLRVGDRVITRDNGLQPITWVGSRTLNWAQLGTETHLRPILISQGSLGSGLPESDMLVSPNHRVLIASDQTAVRFNEPEVLVASRTLIGKRGISTVQTGRVIYIHFMLARHQVVLSNGAWTESFQPTHKALDGLGNAQRNEIYEILPELREALGEHAFPATRPTVSGRMWQENA